MKSNQPKSVNCPNCQLEVEWLESNNFRPFCSERCKLIDFGEWATEKKSIAGEPVMPDFEEESLQ